MKITIVKANIEQLEAVSGLFDAYRVFYNQPSDVARGKKFLENRFLNNENIIFLAMDQKDPVGFVQLYKTFSSVTTQAFYILNDLFVKPEYRGRAVGQDLLKKVQEFCVQSGYKGVALETANDNPAQKLYERSGWKKDVNFLHYFWKAPDA